MDDQMAQQYCKQLNAKIYSKYYHQFTALLQFSKEGLAIENQIVFYSFCLSEILQAFIENHWETVKTKHPYHGCESIITQILRVALQDEEVKFLIAKLEKESELKEERKIQKDRKTSFFRTILKHIKSLTKEIRRNHKIIHSDILTEIQVKLSKNTISAASIQKLFDSYGNIIIEYLNSTQVYKDLLNINKSKTNKAFYLLHLRQIAVEAQKGKLSEYPFFSRLSIKDKVKSIVQTCASSLIERGKSENRFSIDQNKTEEQEMRQMEAYEGLQLESLVECCEQKCEKSPHTEQMLSEAQIELWIQPTEKVVLDECFWEGENDFIRY